MLIICKSVVFLHGHMVNPIKIRNSKNIDLDNLVPTLSVLFTKCGETLNYISVCCSHVSCIKVLRYEPSLCMLWNIYIFKGHV